jgi:uncharacterized protein YjbI with pentapeptide repeats
MTKAPARPTDDSLPPGVIEVIKKPLGPTLVVLTAEEWERRYGLGNHISFGASMPATQPGLAADAGSSVVCPACHGEGFLGWVGTASTCIFCVGAKQVARAEAGRYDSWDPLRGAEPTLRRIRILLYEMDARDQARQILEDYGFTLERLETELDEEDLDRMWGFDGRNLAGRDFIDRRPDGTPYERWEACDFSGSTLTGANFVEVDLADANFVGADLTDAIFTGANLTRVTFTDADLTRATLDGAALFRADLSNINLSGASLRGASLVGAHLDQTILDDAEVTGADFRGAKGLDPGVVADLRDRGAIVDDPAG